MLPAAGSTGTACRRDDRPAMGGADMTERFFVAFDYDVLRASRHDGAGTTALRRDTAVIEIPAVRSADLAVAYRVEHRRDLGPGRHPILRHAGRLWWPLVDTTLEPRTARDFLNELRAGRSDLFVRRSLDHLFLEPRRRRQVIHNGRDDALAAVHRNAGNLLIVDDGLYAAGGVPLLVKTFRGLRRIFIASTGADRAVAAPAGTLRVKPALGHRGIVDYALCRYIFYMPGHPPGPPEQTEAIARRWAGIDGIAIEIVDGEVVDWEMVCVDAAFRIAWTAMNRSIPRTRPEGFELLRARFVEACGAANDDCLTLARYRALQGFMKLFEWARPKPVAVSDALEPVRQALFKAALSGRFPDPTPEPWTEDDVAALARLV
jgi:hypothetical protein